MDLVQPPIPLDDTVAPDGRGDRLPLGLVMVRPRIK
jgi:hypothetical protein